MLQGFENIITAIRDWVNFKFQPKGNYSLVENTGYSLSLNIDSDYVMTLELKNADGDVLSTKSIDFPIESMVIGADYANGVITLTLQNGQTLDVDVSALVNGLVNDTFTIAGIDMKDDITKEELATALGIGDKLDKDGDASETTVTFAEATTRENITSGEKISVTLGKIKKWFADLKTVAFTGSYDDLSNAPDIPTKTSDLTNDSEFITSEGGSFVNENDRELIVDADGLQGDGTQKIEYFNLIEADEVKGNTLYYNEEDTDERYLKNEDYVANTAQKNGIVKAGKDSPNMAWMTDENGNPDWRTVPSSGSVNTSDFISSKSGGTVNNTFKVNKVSTTKPTGLVELDIHNDGKVAFNTSNKGGKSDSLMHLEGDYQNGFIRMNGSIVDISADILYFGHTSQVNNIELKGTQNITCNDFLMSGNELTIESISGNDDIIEYDTPTFLKLRENGVRIGSEETAISLTRSMSSVNIGRDGNWVIETKYTDFSNEETKKRVKIRGGTNASIEILNDNNIVFGSENGKFIFKSFYNSGANESVIIEASPEVDLKSIIRSAEIIFKYGNLGDYPDLSGIGLKFNNNNNIEHREMCYDPLEDFFYVGRSKDNPDGVLKAGFLVVKDDNEPRVRVQRENTWLNLELTYLKHGLWSSFLNDWLFYLNTADRKVYINGNTEVPSLTHNNKILDFRWDGDDDTIAIGFTDNDEVLFLTKTTFHHNSSGIVDLGQAGNKWKNIYATNGVIQTSDRNEKNNIEELTNEKAQALIYGLKPSTYQMNGGTSGRIHWGMISQDIEELLEDLGWTSSDFAGFIKSPKEEVIRVDENGEKLNKPIRRVIEGEYTYSLRYDEFIAPMVKVIQSQNERIKALEKRIELLEQ